MCKRDQSTMCNRDQSTMCKRDQLFVTVVKDRLYLADAASCRQYDNAHVFKTDGQLTYVGYCDDFGPMNLGSVLRFIEMLDAELANFPSHRIFYCPEEGTRNVTNAAFLLGAYMILSQRATPEETWRRFRGRCDFENYRDATYMTPDFGLTLLDCWRGLALGKSLGWISISPLESMYDIEEYEHYDSPINGELHVVVPDKFVAFRGPMNLSSDAEYEDIDGARMFSARYYVDMFKDLGVSTIIRLNEPLYDKEIFEDAGFEHFDLEFEDCTSPPNDIVARFMRIVDHAPGMIAVHCKAGLGRTGTLIALFLMLAHGFRARDAIGWLRIVRPGCVIGEQQHYLCQVEKRLREARGSQSANSACVGDSQARATAEAAEEVKHDASRSAEQARQVSDAICRRGLSPPRPERAATRHHSTQEIDLRCCQEEST